MAITETLNPELEENNVRIFVNKVFDGLVTSNKDINSRLRTLKPAKNLQEVYEVVSKALENYQDRMNIPVDARLVFAEDDPDRKIIEDLGDRSKGGIISFGLVKRCPGAFGQGAPFASETRNLRPLFREECSDPENPGYKLGTLGYFHDNIIRFTCWALTNKHANKIAQMFEDFMDEYSWYFKAEGIDRFLFWERGQDVKLDIEGQKWYGRPFDYFVRTEKIKVFSEKTIENIVINVVVKQE